LGPGRHGQERLGNTRGRGARGRGRGALSAGDRVFALFPSIHGHLPDRQFVLADYDGSGKTIVLDGPTAYEREVHDMDRLDGPV